MYMCILYIYSVTTIMTYSDEFSAGSSAHAPSRDPACPGSS